MPRTLLVLTASALLLGACAPPSLVVPSPSIPHQLSRECKTEILVESPSGKVERQKVTIPTGWWVASPSIVEGE